MQSFIYFILFFTSILLGTQATNEDCKTTKCTHGEPDIRFPFQVRGQQPQHCGHPGYEIDCNNNTTTIHFPSYGDLVVKSISYEIKKLDLLDPKNCVHEVFLNLNLSLTPFQYYYVVKEYSYLNCSVRLSPSFSEVPCLGGAGYHVYTVEPSFAVPDSCRVVKTIPIPFGYSSYLSDNSFGLGVTWGSDGPGDSEAKECFTMTHVKVLCIGIFMFAVAALIRISMRNQSKKLQCCQKEGQDQIQVEKLLGDYKALFKLEKYDHNADLKKGESQPETVLDIKTMKHHSMQVVK